jgi:hypothetical protein
VACLVAAGLILAAPFVGEVRRAILLRFPGQFGVIIGGIVVVLVAAAVGLGLARIRGRRGARYLMLAGAVGLAAGYAFFTRTGEPQVDAVERFHFVEYGLVTFLFYRAWKHSGDLSILVLPAIAGLLVGTLEEWFQWFIPARVGDVGDVFLNGVAIACGLLFSVAVDPPERWTLTLPRPALRRIGTFLAVALVVFGGFFQSVHLGHAVAGDGWRFRSGFTAADLDKAAAARAVQWRGQTIGRPQRLSREDQYLTEGHSHVQRRNEAWAAGDAASAWRENLILERYFAPVLDTPSYLSPTGHRWDADHRAEAERQGAPSTAFYESQAHPGAILLWPRAVYWPVLLMGAAALSAPWLTHRRPSRTPAHNAPQP